jgi:hypothetical protein
MTYKVLSDYKKYAETCTIKTESFDLIDNTRRLLSHIMGVGTRETSESEALKKMIY